MYKVLLISFANWDSLAEVPAILTQGGCSLDIFCAPGSWALQNNFYSAHIPASEREESFVNQLFDYVEKNGHLYDWIIPGDDAIIRILNDRITDETLFYRIMPITKIENRQLLGSKAGFSELCSKYGIKTPRYMIYSDGLTPESIGAYMGYPLLMKLDQSESGYGVFLCNNEQELATHLQATEHKSNLVFQQFIKGYDINTEVLYKDGELLVYSYSRTLKIMGKFGVSTRRLFYHNNEVETELQHIGRSLGLNGFGNVVFMYDEEAKEHYLIEIDARPNAWMYYGRFMGNNFSEGIKKLIAGDHTLVKPDARFMEQKTQISLYKKDMHRCILEKDWKGIAGWIINKHGCWQYIPRYDRKLLGAINRFLLRSFKELFIGKMKKVVGG